MCVHSYLQLVLQCCWTPRYYLPQAGDCGRLTTQFPFEHSPDERLYLLFYSYLITGLVTSDPHIVTGIPSPLLTFNLDIVNLLKGLLIYCYGGDCCGFGQNSWFVPPDLLLLLLLYYSTLLLFPLDGCSSQLVNWRTLTADCACIPPLLITPIYWIRTTYPVTAGIGWTWPVVDPSEGPLWHNSDGGPRYSPVIFTQCHPDEPSRWTVDLVVCNEHTFTTVPRLLLVFYLWCNYPLPKTEHWLGLLLIIVVDLPWFIDLLLFIDLLF